MTLNGEKMILAMARQRLTKKALAEKAGVSRGRLNVIMNSKNTTPATAGKIAAALNVDVTEIIEKL